MADYPFTHGKHEGIMASEMYKKKSYTKWAMEQENATGPVLIFQNYVLARRGASSSPEPPATPGAGSSSPVPPATPGVAPPSPAPPGAEPSLLRKLDRLERKVDALTELVRCLMTWEEPPSAAEPPSAMEPPPSTSETPPSTSETPAPVKPHKYRSGRPPRPIACEACKYVFNKHADKYKNKADKNNHKRRGHCTEIDYTGKAIRWIKQKM